MSDERSASGLTLESLRERLVDGMDRRAFLRTVGAAGYGVGMAQLLGVEDFLNVPEGSVPVVTALARSADGGPLRERTTTVPTDWYRAVINSFRLHHKLTATTVPGYLGSAVLPGDYERATAPIVVNVSRNGFGRARRTLQRLIEEGPFTLNVVTRIPEAVEAQTVSREPIIAESLPDNRVPGGVRCQNGTGDATLPPALYTPTHTPVFGAAAHMYEESEDPVGESLMLPRADAETTTLGTVTGAYQHADLAIIEPTGTLEPASEIVTEDGTTQRVSGQYTRLGLATLAARDEPLEKMAAQTGHTSGYINGIDAVTCFTGECHQGQLTWGDEANFTDGDSGSVSFHTDPEDPEAVLIAGFNNARTWWPGQDFIWGVAAYQVYNRYGYHF